MTTIDDFLKILDDHPAWLEAVRARILGHELLQLPSQVNALTSQVNALTSQVNALAARFDAFVERVEAFIAEQIRFNASVEAFIAEQIRFNASVEAFIAEQRRINERVETFIQQQQAFNAEQIRFNERVEGFITEQIQFNERVDGFITEQIQFNERVDGFITEQIQFNERVDGFITEQRGINERIEGFIAEQRRFNANAEARMHRIESDIGTVKGGHVEIRLRDLALSFVDEIECDLIELPALAELTQISRQIPDATPGQRRSFIRADLIALVKDRASGETFYLAAEGSWTADLRDTNRAQRNARYLTQATGIPAVPVIVSLRNTREVESLIASGAVRWIQLDEDDLAHN